MKFDDLKPGDKIWYVDLHNDVNEATVIESSRLLFEIDKYKEYVIKIETKKNNRTGEITFVSKIFYEDQIFSTKKEALVSAIEGIKKHLRFTHMDLEEELKKENEVKVNEVTK